MKLASWRGWAPAVAISAFMLALVSPAAAQDTTSLGRATLSGLTGVGVVVEAMERDAEEAGLSKSTLQTDVELKLRQAGIRVLSKDERLAAPGSPFVYLRVSIFRSEVGVYAYSITLGVDQAVRLLRDPTITSVATTWETGGGVGLAGSKTLLTVREHVRDNVDKFLNDYLAANPKR